MKKVLSLVLALVMACGGLSFSSFAAAQEDLDYSYVDIVNEMLDMETLSQIPLAGEKTAEFSSYDRASQYNAQTDTYSNWGANGDGGGVIQNLGNVEGKGTRYLVAQMEGPGAIRRIWSARASTGLIEIYIDGEETPTISVPFNQLFNGTNSMFNYSALSYTAASGLNCFVPITYNESCEVYLYGDWGQYYQFTYTTLPEGSTVESMPSAFSAEERAALTEVNDFFRNNLGTNPTDLSGAALVAGDFVVEAGGETAVLDYSGAGAVAQFKVKVDGVIGYNEMWQALKELTVSMYWDGETSPSVWAPLGDFFGSPCGPSYYVTLPMGLTSDDWFYCYFYMPFADGARIVIGNDGETDKNISVDAAVTALPDTADAYTRFHAKWNKNANQPTRADRWPDYTVLDTTGSGRFLGMSLQVYKTDNNVDPSSGAGGYWWGEGDEKFFVDGEKFPSFFGTGSEDYFGYAWCDPTLFTTRPYHAQNYNEGGVHERGNKAVLRYQLVDSVPFFSSFEGAIEKYYRDNTEYGVVAYWYLTPDGADGYAPVSLESRTSFYTPRPIPEDEKYTLEAEAMTWTPAADAYVQTMVPNYSNYGWSGSRQVLWNRASLGQTMDFSFQVKQALSGELKISVTKSFDFGTFEFYLDGKQVGGQIDTYNPKVINNSNILLGQVALEPGVHTFSAVSVGRNSLSSGYLLGFDCLKVDPKLPVANIIEGEDMEVLLATGGNPVQQNIAIEWPSAGAYSNGKQLWWTTTSANAQAKNIANGDKLVLALDLAEAVDTEMQMFFTKADDYGIMQLSLDGETLGDPIDFYDVNVVRTEKVSFGRVQLEAGRHELTVDIVGKNASSANYLFGLDNIVFSSQKIDAAILGDAGKISGKQGTSFNVPVQVRSFPEESAMAIEGMITLPDGVEVVDVTPTNSIVYGSFDYSVVDGILRYVFVNTDGSDITVDLRDDTEILTLKLQLSENKVIGDTLRTTATRLTVKDADTFFEYDVSTYESTSIATVISTGAFTATPRELYTGDGIDLIPEGKKAVAIEFTGIDGTEDLTLYGKQLYYSSEKSEKTGKITYVGLVDTDVTLEQMSDTSAYGVSSDPAKLLSFGDTDSDGVLNAQDALAVVSAWLRKTPAPNEFDILVMNVSADSRINSSDAVEIIDKYVSGIDFTVVAK